MTLPIRVVILLLILVGSGAGAENIDVGVFRAINQGMKSKYLDKLIGPLGEWSGPFEALVLSPLFVKGIVCDQQDSRDTVVLTVVALSANTLATLTIKYTVNRERPCKHLEDVHVLGRTGGSPSFPSGHASRAFAWATVLADRYKSYRLPLYGYAALVGFSRVYSGQHYPSDVLAGALLGYGVARITLHFQDEVLSRLGMRKQGKKASLLFDGDRVYWGLKF